MDKKTFNIIRHRGQLNTAQVINKTVERQEQIFIPEYEGFIPCASYDDEFIFENPYQQEHSPVYQCTCGSVAVIVGPSGYVWDASPQGKMLVCLSHATYGVHAVGGSRWI